MFLQLSAAKLLFFLNCEWSLSKIVSVVAVFPEADMARLQ